jgi:hypothetical protein
MSTLDIKMNALGRLSQPIRQCLLRWPMEWLGGLLGLMGLWVVAYTYQSSEAMVQQYAAESAQAHATSVTQFRNFYTQELVPRALQGACRSRTITRRRTRPCLCLRL